MKLTDRQLYLLGEKARSVRRERSHVIILRHQNPQWKDLIESGEKLADATERDLLAYMKEVLE